MSTCTEYRLGEIVGNSALKADTGPNLEGAPLSRLQAPNVLIYRNDLIEKSETFILSQATSMRRYKGIFCGMSRKDGGILPQDAPHSLLVQVDRRSGFQNLLRKRAFMTASFAPNWRRRCRALHPALMHAHFAVDGAFALPLQGALKVPLIVSLHGYDVTSTDEAFGRSAGGRLYLRRQKQLFARTDLFVCVSNFIRDEAIKRGFPPEKLWVHSIGIDVNTFQIDDSVRREPTVLFVGRLVEKKGCSHLIAAMGAVQEAMPMTQLVIIGDGPLRQRLEDQAARSLPGGYKFLGAQPPVVVHSWLQRAMVFCAPSVTAANGDREGLGMVFCEAQATGTPVVSTRSGGIPEVVVDGVTGLLLPERDQVGLAQGICRLLKDRDCWSAMSRHGRERVRKNFNLSVQTEKLEAKYDEIVATSRRNQFLHES